MRLAWLALAAGLIAAPAFAQQGSGALALLQAADANHDGSITRAEAQFARGLMFGRLDADRDGYLSQAERSAADRRGGDQGQRGWARADANHDGRISRAEMTNLPYRGFDWLDRNRDDVVSADEIERARIFLQGR